MVLADKIIILRKKQGWSQEKMAQKLNVSRQSVSKWESGQSVPELDKVVDMSALFGVTTDMLLMESFGVDDTLVRAPVSDGIKRVSSYEATGYLRLMMQQARKIALAAMMIIDSPISLIILNGMSQSGDVDETLAIIIGTVVLLGMIATGVYIIIFNGFGSDKYAYMDRDSYVLDYGVRDMIVAEKNDYEGKFRKNVAFDAALIIVSLIPAAITSMTEASEIVCAICVSILLGGVGMAAYGFVLSGIRWDAYEKLLLERERGKADTMHSRCKSVFGCAYWCVTAVAYLTISFTYANWYISWVIWPLAAVIYTAVREVVSVITGRDY